MTARLLMIGLDGADGRMLDRATRDGTLPNLAALRARGHGWALSSAPSATDDALWASFQYGGDVGEHGRYSYQLSPPSQPSIKAITAETDRETFWDKLSQSDTRIAVFDVPKCRQPRPLNGIHLADWLVHGRYFQDGPVSYPPMLAGEVLRRFGAAPPSLCSYEPPTFSDADVRTARDNLLHAVGQKRAAGLHYLATEPWDLFIIAFKEAHCASHLFWEFADPEHIKYDATRVARLGNPVFDILKTQDEAVGALIAAAGLGANIVVFSTSDFMPNGSLRHLMSPIVQRVNLHMISRARQRVVNAARRVLSLGPAPYACQLMNYSDNAVALRVPRRTSDNNRRYARRLDQIEALVRELKDADDGKPVVAAVTRPASEHNGAHAADLPHLLLHFRANICPAAVTSPHLGRIEGTRPDNIRSGNHLAGGFAFAAGPGLHDAAAQVGSLQDFAALAADVLRKQKLAPTG